MIFFFFGFKAEKKQYQYFVSAMFLLPFIKKKCQICFHIFEQLIWLIFAKIPEIDFNNQMKYTTFQSIPGKTFQSSESCAYSCHRVRFPSLQDFPRCKISPIVRFPHPVISPVVRFPSLQDFLPGKKSYSKADFSLRKSFYMTIFLFIFNQSGISPINP